MGIGVTAQKSRVKSLKAHSKTESRPPSTDQHRTEAQEQGPKRPATARSTQCTSVAQCADVEERSEQHAKVVRNRASQQGRVRGVAAVHSYNVAEPHGPRGVPEARGPPQRTTPRGRGIALCSPSVSSTSVCRGQVASYDNQECRNAATANGRKRLCVNRL